jgi:hypothetical protein
MATVSNPTLVHTRAIAAERSTMRNHAPRPSLKAAVATRRGSCDPPRQLRPAARRVEVAPRETSYAI